MTLRQLRKLVVLFAALAAGPVLGQAQTTGRIQGTVLNEAGAPVAGARVNLVSSALQGERVLKSNERGEFLAPLLPVGPYAVSVAAPGKNTVQVSLRVTVGQTDALRIVLEPGDDVTEKVTVYAGATTLETTVIGENFNYPKQVEELPIAQRRIERIVALAPNVSNPANRNQDYVSIAGADPSESAWLLDGAELTDGLKFIVPTMYLEDTIQEVQVMTAGVSARYGRFQGGVVNAITKTGGNQFDGSVRAEFSKESWNETTPLREAQSSTVDDIYQATLGGYMVKDRLWFFLGGRTVPTRSTSGVTRDTLEGFTGETSEDRIQFKLRGALTPEHVLEVNYLEYEIETSGRTVDFCCFPADSLAANGRGSFPRDITTLSYQGIVGPTTFVEFLASKKHVASARGGDPAGGSPFADVSGDVYFGYHNNALDPRDSIARDNETVGANLTRVLSTKTAGSHTLEAGVQYVNSITSGAGRFSVNNFSFGFAGGATPFTTTDPVTGELTFNVNSAFAGGDQFNIRFEDIPFSSEQEVENWAVYVHDAWTFGKWRADLGLRWEQYDAEGPFGSLGIKQSDLAPRAALTYNIRPDWQVQASAGKYIGRLDDATLGNQTGIDSAPQAQTWYVGPAGTGLSYDEVEALLFDDSNWAPRTVSDPATPVALISQDAKLPYSTDFNVSMKWALPRGTGWANVSYIYRDYHEIWDGRVGDEGSVSVPFPRSADDVEFDRIIWDNEPAAERTYQALVLAADYRPGPHWTLGGNWTLAELKGNTETFGFGLGGFGSWLGTYERSRPEDAAVPEGSLNDDLRHRINLWATYRFDFARAGDLVLGVLGRHRSGGVWSHVAPAPTTPDPQGMYVNRENSYQHFFGGRGINEFDDVSSIDLSARYQAQLHRQLDAWVKVTITNLFNDDTLIQYDTTGFAETGIVDCPGCVVDEANDLTWRPDSTFGAARGVQDYQTPRSYLVTLGLLF